jgi:hypothetical protein
LEVHRSFAAVLETRPQENPLRREVLSYGDADEGSVRQFRSGPIAHGMHRFCCNTFALLRPLDGIADFDLTMQRAESDVTDEVLCALEFDT